VGFFLGLFVAVDLVLFGVIRTYSNLVTILPVVGLVLGAAWGWWSPIGRHRVAPPPAAPATTDDTTTAPVVATPVAPAPVAPAPVVPAPVVQAPAAAESEPAPTAAGPWAEPTSKETSDLQPPPEEPTG